MYCVLNGVVVNICRFQIHESSGKPGVRFPVRENKIVFLTFPRFCIGLFLWVDSILRVERLEN